MHTTHGEVRGDLLLVTYMHVYMNILRVGTQCITLLHIQLRDTCTCAVHIQTGDGRVRQKYVPHMLRWENTRAAKKSEA